MWEFMLIWLGAELCLMFVVTVRARAFRFLWCPYFYLSSWLWGYSILLLRKSKHLVALSAIISWSSLSVVLKCGGEGAFYNPIQCQSFSRPVSQTFTSVSVSHPYSFPWLQCSQSICLPSWTMITIFNSQVK